MQIRSEKVCEPLIEFYRKVLLLLSVCDCNIFLEQRFSVAFVVCGFVFASFLCVQHVCPHRHRTAALQLAQ